MATQMEAIVKAPQVTTDQLDLVRKTVAKDATADELKLYLYDCERQGVHPLDKLIHFTKRGGRYTPITSIDFMRIRAADSGCYAGNDDPEMSYEPGNDAGYPATAKVTVYRMVEGQRCAFTATARWREYYPGDKEGWAWKKMPNLMLGKVAEALALRKAFPKQLAGLYAKEEMDQAGADKSTPTTKTFSGIVTGCKALEAYSVLKLDGKTPIVVMDGAYDSLLAQMAESEKKRSIECECIQKPGPRGKYWELSKITKVDGKPYLEGALEMSIEKVKAEKQLEITAEDAEFIPDPADDVRTGGIQK